MLYLAHIANINGKRTEQTVLEHLRHTAEYAGEKLRCCGLYNTGYLAGLLHDMGKLKTTYMEYLENAYNGIDVKRGSVNHTFAGVIYILEKYHTDKNDGIDKLTSEIIAFAIGSHHGEFDAVDIDGKNGFEHRLNKDKAEIGYEECVRNYFSFIEENEIHSLFLKSKDEIGNIVDRMKKDSKLKLTEREFILGMTARMVLSGLIDADRRDTAEFMSGMKTDVKEVSSELWERQLNYFEERLKEFKVDTLINKARKYFSDGCADFAKREGGIYRITVPTGAGKTLCMLRYSLAHAKEYNKKRIIFIIPLLSILDQNSKVINDYIKDKDIIKEYHSNVVNIKNESKEKLNEYELLAEPFDYPIVISTLVQLLNMLFADKTTAIRRMSSLCNSVIVIDEVQSLPKNMLNMFNYALNYLAYYCGADIVLSSATQPCFNKVDRSLRLSENPDIIPYDKDIFSVFKRTEVIDKTKEYGMSVEELADFAMEIMDNHYSLLVICNTKKSAFNLYEQLKLLNHSREYKLFHLSTSMCMQHRKDTLAEINMALDDINRSMKKNVQPEHKVICVATQLVEAGVDFSFENVIRVIAGMDNITQAAGRCNRNNDFNRICNVYIVNMKSSDENLKMLREIQISQRCSGGILKLFAQNPDKYDNDLLSDGSIDAYYNNLFSDDEIKKAFDYPVKIEGMSFKLFDMLSHNKDLYKMSEAAGKYILKQSFKTANSKFTVFDENTTDVIVPYNDEAESIIADLCSEKAGFDYNYLKDLIKKAKKYTIQIFEYQKMELADRLYSDEKGHFLALNADNYSLETGLIFDNTIF